MSELGPEAQALLDAEREAKDDTGAARERVRGLLAASLGAAALGRDAAAAAAGSGAETAGAGAGTSAAPAGATGLLGSTAAKLIAAGVIAGAVAVGVVMPRSGEPGTATESGTVGEPETAAAEPGTVAEPSEAVDPGTVAQPVGVAEPSEAVEPVGVQPVEEVGAEASTRTSTNTSTNTRTSTRKGTGTKTGAGTGTGVDGMGDQVRALQVSQAHGPTLQAELAALGAAQGALRQGDAEQALVFLDRHAERYPHGALRQERMAARAVALCMLGRRAEGLGEREALAREAPQSPLLGRVASACKPQ